MSDSRSKNATRNAVYAVLLKLYQTVIPFFVRTVFINVLGMQYVGLNGLFASILGILNLAELGVGTALIFSMYKPVAEHDTPMICALMNYYKKCYRIIGSVIAGAGFMLMPFLRYLIKSNLPANMNLYVIYLINLAGTVSTYFLFAYKNCLFIAHQRNDISSKISFCIETIKYAIQICALVLSRNYYFYIIVLPVCSIVSNLITAALANKTYPEYRSKGKLNTEQVLMITKKIRALFVVKIGNVVLNSVDNIVISAFLGLTILGMYSNYYYIVSSVVSIVGLLTGSMIASLGNSVATESKQKNYNDFLKLSFWNFWLVGWCAICLVCLSQHFIRIWVGAENMLPFGLVLLFAAYFYVLQSNQVAGAYKDAAGIWESDRFRPIVTAGTNLICNLIMVQFIGLYGIVLSTVVSLLIVNTSWLIHNVCKLVFEKCMKDYILYWVRNLVITLLAGVVCYGFCSQMPEMGLKWFFAKGIVCVIAPNLVYFICYFRTKSFKDSLEIIQKIICNLLNKDRNYN